MRGSSHSFLDREDNAVRSTNDEATVGKWSAVNAGYYGDGFVDAFLSHAAPFHGPLMNRGHFARVMAVQQTLLRFILPVESIANNARQVVCLGCGFDTLYFRLAAQGAFAGVPELRYFEVDFAEVVNRKRHILKQDARFHPYLERKQYSLIECDLRDMDSLKVLLDAAGFSHECPTLFISECVLIYMTPEEGGRIISWACETTPQSVFVTYEQIRPDDAFGKTMIRNLQARNIPLHSIMQYPSLTSQEQRYKKAGYSHSLAMAMDQVYERVIPLSERRRVGSLEVFDEYEEWKLVLSHYCLVVSCNGSTDQQQSIWRLFENHNDNNNNNHSQ